MLYFLPFIFTFKQCAEHLNKILFNWLPLPNISQPLNDYVCTSRSSLALEPVPEKNPGSPLFCYDERRNIFGLAGIAFSSTSAKFSNALGHFIDGTEIDKFGLKKAESIFELENKEVTVFYKLENERNWIDPFFTKQNPSKPIWTRGDKIKVKKPPRNGRMSSGNSNVHFSIAIEQLILFFVLIALK